MSVGLGLLAGAVGGFVVLMFAAAIGKAYRPIPAQRSARVPTSDPARSDRPARAAAPMQPVDEPAVATPVSGDATPPAGMRSRLSSGSAVLGYLTVASDRGGDEEGQSAIAIEAACKRAGWELVEIVRDRNEGANLEQRGLRNALERIAEGQAQGLVASHLEGLSRSIVDLGALMAWFRDANATLVALDLDIDTSTPDGEHVAATLIALSARDRKRIASGTRRGLEKGRAAGRPSGRPAVSHRPELVARIAAMRGANMTLRAIADQLNAEGVPTLRGGKKWRPSSIQATLGYRRPEARDHLAPPHARADE